MNDKNSWKIIQFRFFHFIIFIIYRFIEIYKRLIELIVNRVGITKVKKINSIFLRFLRCSGVLFVQIVNNPNIRNSLVSHGRFIHILYSCFSVIVIEIFSSSIFFFRFALQVEQCDAFLLNLKQNMEWNVVFIRSHPFHTQRSIEWSNKAIGKFIVIPVRVRFSLW